MQVFDAILNEPLWLCGLVILRPLTYSTIVRRLVRGRPRQWSGEVGSRVSAQWLCEFETESRKHGISV